MINNQAIFAAGCFWGVEENFRKVQGVYSTSVGYCGGYKENPTYEEVCSNLTGHAEAVLIEFNPKIITYSSLLNEFWVCHDPTTIDRQGRDIGSQYRSEIFYFDENQKDYAENSKEEFSKQNKIIIVTKITQATKFYPAEDYHQKYIQKNYEK